jgi:hypothetical protein
MGKARIFCMQSSWHIPLGRGMPTRQAHMQPEVLAP